MWKHGEYNGFSWCIKVFDEGSRFGINNGRISKLWIQRKQNREEVANYDRGWDVKPFDVLHVAIHRWILKDDGTQEHAEDDYINGVFRSSIPFYYTNKNHREMEE